jgi:hypothetical protein
MIAVQMAPTARQYLYICALCSFVALTLCFCLILIAFGYPFYVLFVRPKINIELQRVKIHNKGIEKKK